MILSLRFLRSRALLRVSKKIVAAKTGKLRNGNLRFLFWAARFSSNDSVTWLLIPASLFFFSLDSLLHYTLQLPTQKRHCKIAVSQVDLLTEGHFYLRLFYWYSFPSFLPTFFPPDCHFEQRRRSLISSNVLLALVLSFPFVLFFFFFFSYGKTFQTCACKIRRADSMRG